MSGREWILRRNCSLAPNQLGLAYLVLCAGSLLVAVFFTLRGAWYVLGFSVIEISAVGAAFFHYARHATDHERIALIDGCLHVELFRAGQATQFTLDAQRTRVARPISHRDLIRLEANEVRVEVGRFLTEWKRREFARELSSALTLGR